MRIVLQRVRSASVTVDGTRVASIDNGLLLLVGVAAGDTEQDAEYLCQKVINMRIFRDDAGKMNLSILQCADYSVLSVSQFTLLADYKRGNRPGFTRAANPAEAQRLYEYFNGLISAAGLSCQTGIFGADMLVESQNDGPVTILLDSVTKE